MRFSYSAAWDETVAMLRNHSPLIAAIAGVFIFLPTVLTSYFLPPPQAEEADIFQVLVDYVRSNLHWFILTMIVNMVGAIAILSLLFGRGTLTVGAAIAGAMTLLLPYFLASALAWIAISIGIALFIVPGIYLLGRLAPVGAIVVAENLRNPFEALKRSFEVTKGVGWAVAGLFLLVWLAGFVVSMVITAVVGSVFLVAAGQQLGGLLVTILNALTGSALQVVLIVLLAAVYRQLGERVSATPSLN